MAPVAAGRYGRLPTFLRFLSTLPDPDGVVRALRDGPLRPFGAASVMLLMGTSDGVLVAIGTVGVTDEIRERYSVVPTSLDIPLTNAYRDEAVTTTDLFTMTDLFPVLEIDGEAWQELKEMNGQAICAAIMSGGRSIGVLSFVIDPAKSLEPVDAHIVESIRHALGMWMSRPEIVVRAEQRRLSTAPYALTERQREIVGLIDAGLTNMEIGERLGYSTSLVKQEIQRMMRGLRVESRADLVERVRALEML